MSMTTNEAPDTKEVKAFSFNVWNYKQGEVVSLMIHLGDRLRKVRRTQVLRVQHV